LLALLLGEIGAAGIGVDLLGLLALLDHLGEQLEQLGIGRLRLADRARSDVAILDRGAHQPERRDASLVLRFGGVLQSSGDGLAHGSRAEHFREEGSKVMEAKSRGKEFPRFKLLFSQENNSCCGLTPPILERKSARVSPQVLSISP